MSIKVALLGTGVDKSLIPHLFVLDQVRFMHCTRTACLSFVVGMTAAVSFIELYFTL